MSQRSNFKPVDEAAQQHSERLRQYILQAIANSGGSIHFADYMQYCLYAPGMGYYSAGNHKLGQGGDFTTAPEISRLFGHTLARHFSFVFEQLSNKNILEFGAGSGKMAADILTQLAQDQIDFECYYIIETSADLKQRQQHYLHEQLPQFANKIVWLDELPSAFEGIIVANEVCDAMPVQLLEFNQGEIYERSVTADNVRFKWSKKEVSNNLLSIFAQKIHMLIGDESYQTEVNLAAPAWLESLAEKLKKGAIFIIDYGYSFNEYYQPERNTGTLRCFYQQQAHEDPLILPGLQDITAHVDFTTLAETALANKLDVAGFHAQADFLLAGGITSLAQQLADTLSVEAWLKESAGLKQLLLPGQMGEQFKVLSLTKALEPLNHLALSDRRYQL